MKDKTLKEMARCIKAVNDEPELPGEMSNEMFSAYQELVKDKKSITDALRILVRLTKAGIRERILNGAEYI